MDRVPGWLLCVLSFCAVVTGGYALAMLFIMGSDPNIEINPFSYIPPVGTIILGGVVAVSAIANRQTQQTRNRK